MIAAGATLDPLQLLLINAGTAGVVVVLVLLGWLWAKPSVEREFKKADEKDTQQQALINTMLADQKEVIPLLLEVDKHVVPLMEATQVMMTATQMMLKRVEALFDRMEREWDWRERRGRVSEAPSGYGPGRDYDDRGRGGGGEGPGPGDNPPGETRPR